jgi:hypothetical protein
VTSPGGSPGGAGACLRTAPGTLESEGLVPTLQHVEVVQRVSHKEIS